MDSTFGNGGTKKGAATGFCLGSAAYRLPSPK